MLFMGVTDKRVTVPTLQTGVTDKGVMVPTFQTRVAEPTFQNGCDGRGANFSNGCDGANFSKRV